MKAVALTPRTNEIALVDRPEPQISAADQVKMRVIRAGICGTDREEIRQGWAQPPGGAEQIILGHEMIGRVVEVGSAVAKVRPGDYAAFTVRRGCGQCAPCLMNRSDMCVTGLYAERGIVRADGFQAEYVVDTEQYVVFIPPALEPVGVLCEPLSVVEKGIDSAVRLEAARVPDQPDYCGWLAGRRCLVTGLGPIGLLAALVLRLRGGDVYGMDIVDSASTRPQWLRKIGGTYIDGRQLPADQVAGTYGAMDLVLEASGAPGLAFGAHASLGFNGVLIVIGAPGRDHFASFNDAAILHRMIGRNQALLGTVNSARVHVQMAVDDFLRAHLLWPGHVEQLITHHVPYTDFALALSEHPQDEIKVVLEWAAE